jgi:hypothetical protein
MAELLEREEYVEQAYFYRTLNERMQQGMSTQELLYAIRQELLSTSRLPLALDFMRTELKHTGGFGTAMAHMGHYFTSFQTYVVTEAERQEGRFDFRIALEILEREAKYRSEGASRQGVFFYQFETLCRNRLGYDAGLEAMAGDPIYDEDWSEWILAVRKQVGLIDFADMIFGRSEHHKNLNPDMERAVLFGEKEGKIAQANRKKDPVFLFSALARHLGYPGVPRPKPLSEEENAIPRLLRTVERLEMRVKLLEEEIRGGINIAKFFAKDSGEKGPQL